YLEWAPKVCVWSLFPEGNLEYQLRRRVLKAIPASLPPDVGCTSKSNTRIFIACRVTPRTGNRWTLSRSPTSRRRQACFWNTLSFRATESSSSSRAARLAAPSGFLGGVDDPRPGN